MIQAKKEGAQIEGERNHISLSPRVLSHLWLKEKVIRKTLLLLFWRRLRRGSAKNFFNNSWAQCSQKDFQDCGFYLWMLNAFPFHIFRKHTSDRLFYMNFDASHGNDCCIQSFMASCLDFLGWILILSYNPFLFSS